MQELLTDFQTFADEVLNYQLFKINETPISLMSAILFLVVLIVFFLTSKLLVRSLLKRILPRFQIDSGIQYNMRRIAHYLLMTVGALVAFQFIGIDLSGLAVVLGFLSVGIGFGLQNVTSNFISGLIMLFERPVKVGDRVAVADTEGDVTAINMRATTIRTPDNITIIVPNSEFISSNVINWSHGELKIRLNIPVGVSYGSNLDNVIKALEEVADENEEVLSSPKPLVHLSSFGDSAWDMNLRCWIAQPERHPQVTSDLNCAIVRKFREYDIEIPFPQRDLHVRSPLPIPHTSIDHPDRENT